MTMKDIIQTDHDPVTLAPLLRRYEIAKERRRNWESLWREVYDYALPQRNSLDPSPAGSQRVSHLY
ncbi:MAG: hypothetical protein KDJ15_06265, partial [Alphaproteobacteria bacterium]|nr:hypothetical protein [Alphaproteobacteria bacterium]